MGATADGEAEVTVALNLLPFFLFLRGLEGPAADEAGARIGEVERVWGAASADPATMDSSAAMHSVKSKRAAMFGNERGAWV